MFTTQWSSILYWLLFFGTSNAKSPKRYQKGDRVSLTVDSITSFHTQLSYNYYDLPVCQTRPGDHVDDAAFHLGWPLIGHGSQDSPIELNLFNDVYCKPLCHVSLENKNKIQRMDETIRSSYHAHWLVDDLPVAFFLEDTYRRYQHYAGGFPLGIYDRVRDLSYVHNHFRILIDVHLNDDGTYSIVGAALGPLSIQHQDQAGSVQQNRDNDSTESQRQQSHCGNYDKNGFLRFSDEVEKQSLQHSEEIFYTYDVVWKLSEIAPEDRFDIYLNEDHLVPPAVHWYSIHNSLFLILVLTVWLVGILRQNIRDDTEDEYPDESVAASATMALLYKRNEELEEKGWKVVAMDSFSPPSMVPGILAACCGTGAQLLGTISWTIGLLALGIVNPASFTAEDGALKCALLSYGPFGLLNGFVTSQICKSFAVIEAERKKATRWSMVGFPGITIVIFLFLNICASWGMSSFGPPPISSCIGWAVSVLAISACTVYLGAIVGYYRTATIIELSKKTALPTRPAERFLLGISFHRNRFKNMSRKEKGCTVAAVVLLNLISVALVVLLLVKRLFQRRNWWSPSCGGFFVMCLCGICSLGVMYVELFFVSSATWFGLFFNEFGFLFAVMWLELITCGLSAILFGYHQLCHEGCFSWWWQFAAGGGGVVLFTFLFQMGFANTLEMVGWYPHVMYWLVTMWIDLVLLMTTGCAGVLFTLYFVNATFTIVEKKIRDNQA